MCGIVGRVGVKADQSSENAVLAGLATLEYRGYDSAGIAASGPGGEITVVKRVGKLANLRQALTEQPLPPALAAIGHTRWATHGLATNENAHPHVAENLALVHNGIIENASQIRQRLSVAGYHFYSDTDTETVAKLLAENFSRGEFRVTPEVDLPESAQRLGAALMQTAAELVGAFTLLIVHRDCPDLIFAARRSSPLVVGVEPDGGCVLASDTLAFPAGIDTAIEVGQDEFAVVSAFGPILFDHAGKAVTPATFPVTARDGSATKEGWPTFMEKEIHEQPNAIARTLADRTDASGFLTLDELRIPQEVLRGADKMIIIACGTAAYAGHVARYAIEHWCRIPVEVDLAHEFRYRDAVVNEKTLVVAISQSGETMDTVMALRHAREQGARVIAVVNTPGSSISREADAVLLTHAGPEIAVASTKAFTAQVTACFLLGLYLAQVRGNKYVDEVADYLEKLALMPNKVQELLDGGEKIRQIARELAEVESIIYLGRHVGYPVALEGALKVKEIAYIHAEGFAAGELKHGPIALIEAGQVVIVIVPTPRRPELHAKVLSNIREVQARGARTIVIAEADDTLAGEHADYLIEVPHSPTLYLPLLTVVPLQIFACELAKAKGLDVDQPRNLAKSVTVE